jgi:hypothetical protein
MKNSYDGNFFFLLSKGMNAGKPMEKPCPNCFVIFASSEEEKQKLFWLCFGLWQGDFFRPFLTGSVIPFIRLDNLKQVIREALTKLKDEDVKKSLAVLQEIQKHQEHIYKQLDLIRQAKKALMYRVLK